MSDFDDNVQLLIPVLQKITTASKAIRSAKKFPKVIELILAIGNAMNGAKWSEIKIQKNIFYFFKESANLRVQNCEFGLLVNPEESQGSELHVDASFGRQLYEKSIFWN